MITWKEPLSLRRNAYQGRYEKHFLFQLFVWAIWSLIIIGGITWGMGTPPWSGHFVSTIAFVGGCSLLIRLIMEMNARKIEINGELFRIHHIKWYSCPLELISNVRFKAAEHDFVSMQFDARAQEIFRKRSFVIGVDQRTGARIESLFEMAELPVDNSTELPKVSASDQMAEHTRLLHRLYIRFIGWACIAGGTVIAVRALMLNDFHKKAAGDVIALLAVAAGISVIREGLLVRIYRRILDRGRK